MQNVLRQKKLLGKGGEGVRVPSVVERSAKEFIPLIPTVIF